MNRPLLITDCDEVLLHMVTHFRTWLGEAHAIEFDLATGDFANALRRRDDGTLIQPAEMWPLLNGFFVTEMARQTLVPGAREALETLSSRADVVVLTNLRDEHQQSRAGQLAALGINHRVVCNQGGKGEPVLRLLDEYAPSAAVFVDDLAVHHASVAKHAPGVHRLHMIAEPALARLMPPAPAAHARIDDWAQARDWIAERLTAGVDATGAEMIGEPA